MSFFAPNVGGIWKQLEGYGIEPRPLFKEAGVDPDVMFDPGARIPYAAFDELLHRSIEASRDSGFGLTTADYFRPAHMGALGFAWLASTNLRDGFARLARYSRMINDKLKVTLEDKGADFLVTIDAEQPTRHPAVREDMQLAITVSACRRLAGSRFAPGTVWFRQREPADTSRHYELFRCPLQFEAGRTGLAIPSEVIDQRLTGSDEQLAMLNEHIVVKYLAHREKNDIVNRTRASIIDSLGAGGVTETTVANQLYMTPRNLHRRLQKESTTFKVLLNEVRQDLAEQYIRDRSLTLTEISFMLGFAEVSSFSRAYKHWTGLAPSAVRRGANAAANGRGNGTGADE